MRKDIETILFALLRFEIVGTELSDAVKKQISPEMLPELYRLSKRHDLAHLIADALDKNGLLPADSELKKRFSAERQMAVFRYEGIQYEYEQICETLEAAQIPFLPLKGAVMRAYYPEPWMRTSCDIDVLVHEEDLQAAISRLESGLNYKTQSITAHDAQMYAEGGVHLELHYKLVSEGGRYASTLEKVWETDEKSSAFQRRMSEETFYFYHIVHMANHFKEGGCGVRSLIDLWLLERNIRYDEEKKNALLKEGGLLAFANAASATAKVWLEEAQENEITKKVGEYILYAGMYGDLQHRIAIQQEEKGGKFSYILSRIFAPYAYLKFQYPILQKHKWLTPFYQVRRWGRLLFRNRAKQSLQELNMSVNMSETERKRIRKLFEDLEL